MIRNSHVLLMVGLFCLFFFTKSPSSKPVPTTSITVEQLQYYSRAPLYHDNHTMFQLHPWLSKVFPRKHNYIPDTAGIVMTTGNWHAKFAFHAAKVLQTQTQLPIQLFYDGPHDLDIKWRERFTSIGVQVFDLRDFIDSEGLGLGGWAAKPFSMLFSTFQHLIFVDADVLFLQDPAVMLNYKEYKETGTLFFRDRTLYPRRGPPHDFFHKIVKKPSKYAKEHGRYYSYKSYHEGESGVVVWDKARNYEAILMACSLNNQYRSQLYKAYHGDKETYWLAHEIVGLPYRWAPFAGGTIGYHDEKGVCGGLYHPDPEKKPLWFNGGLLKNKYHDTGKQIMNFTHWATDVNFKRVEWEWETKTKPFCLKSDHIGLLTSSEKQEIEHMIHLWKSL